MSDEVADILAEMAGAPAKDGPAGGHAPPEVQWRLADGAARIDKASFDERGYLSLNPDVATSVAYGEFPSGYHHYMVHGFGEGRTVPGTPTEPRNRILRPAARAVTEIGPTTEIPFIVEAVIVAATGAIMAIGWIDDSAAPLKLLRIGNAEWRVSLAAAAMFRHRVDDSAREHEGCCQVAVIHEIELLRRKFSETLGRAGVRHHHDAMGDTTSRNLGLHKSLRRNHVIRIQHSRSNLRL